MKNENSIAESILIIFLSIFSIIFSPILSGKVLSILWLWFIVPIFKVPEISLPFAIGIGTTIAFCVSRNVYETKEEKEDKTLIYRDFFYSFMKPLVYLAFAWVVKHFI